MKPLSALLVSLSIAGSAVAQGYPSKPISLVIPFGAGGDSDLSGRLLAQYVSKYLGNVRGLFVTTPERLAEAPELPKYVREQYELYDRLIGALGIRQ